MLGGSQNASYWVRRALARLHSFLLISYHEVNDIFSLHPIFYILGEELVAKA